MSESSTANVTCYPKITPSIDSFIVPNNVAKSVALVKGAFRYVSEITPSRAIVRILSTDEKNLNFIMVILSNMYKLRRPNEIRDFLQDNEYLNPLLSDAYNNLQSYFPGSTIFMEVEHGELVISVGTKLPPEQAIENLDKFDEEWWLDACIDSRAKLCITVEYQ